MSVNKIILIGHVGADPVMRTLADGRLVANFSVATSRKIKGSEETEWHRCSAFDKVAEIAQNYVKKGSHIYVEGRTKTRKWTAQDGTQKETTEVVVGHIQLLDKRQPADEPAPGLNKHGMMDDDEIPF